MTIQIQRYLEYEISRDLHAAIEELRNSCFPEHRKSRSYGKQFPHFRFLAFSGEQLVGHLGVDHRAMRFGDQVYSVFGAIDLCVAEAERGGGMGGRLLCELEQCARSGGGDLMLLFAQDHRLYTKQGFRDLSVECHWLGIDRHRSLGMMEEEITGEMMVKPLSLEAPPEGPVDFLGYLY